MLFSSYIEEASTKLRNKNIEGIKVNGILVQILRFATDITKIIDNEDDIVRMLYNLDKTLKTRKRTTI